MKRLIASLLTTGTLIPLMWYSVVPNGVAICKSDTPFATVLDTESNIAAAKLAKGKFCRVVFDFVTL